MPKKEAPSQTRFFIGRGLDAMDAWTEVHAWVGKEGSKEGLKGKRVGECD